MSDLMIFENSSIQCDHPASSSEFCVGFLIVKPKKGEVYLGRKRDYNTLVFLLEGHVEFSYNEYLNRRFTAGDFFFVPQDSEMCGIALEDSKMLVLTHDFIPDNHCASRALSKVKRGKEVMKGVNYDFRPFRMTPMLINFAKLMCDYFARDYGCRLLHELKQKELFIILHHEYSSLELKEMFYPIIGVEMNFRSRILELAHEQLTVSELAARFNMGERSFARKFKSELGLTVRQWMLQHKAAKTKLKLVCSDVSILNVVEEFKFQEVSHFHRFSRE